MTAPAQLTLADWIDEAAPEHRGRRRSIAERFRAFHEAHPEVYSALVRLAREAKEIGVTRYGIKALVEVARWDLNLRSRDADGYRINNDFTSLYSRLIMANERDLDGFFETRERRAA